MFLFFVSKNIQKLMYWDFLTLMKWIHVILRTPFSANVKTHFDTFPILESFFMCNAENKTKYISFKTKKGVDRKMKVCSAFLVGFKLAVEYFNQITKIKQYAKRKRNQRG